MRRLLTAALVACGVLTTSTLSAEANIIDVNLSLNVGVPTAGSMFGVSEATNLDLSFRLNTAHADVVLAGTPLGSRVFEYDLYRFDLDDIQSRFFSPVVYGTQTWTAEDLFSVGFGSVDPPEKNVVMIEGGLTNALLRTISIRLVDRNKRLDWATCGRLLGNNHAVVSECGTISDGFQLAVLNRNSQSISPVPLSGCGPSGGVPSKCDPNALSAVPLPASAWLLISALGGLGIMAWHRRRAAA